MEIEQLMRPGIKDEYGIQKLQNIILNIMKVIHYLCERHHIDYYIIGGTALGAVRHGGFIPWDDDLDIAMTRENYDKFIEVCNQELDKNVFYLQVGRKDWPLYFSKLRLKGTLFDEEGAGEEIAKENRGIFVDIFPLDNASNYKVIRSFQYFCSKILIANALSERKQAYHTGSAVKRFFILFALPLKFNAINRFMYRQVTNFNKRKTNYIGDFFEKSRLKDASYPIALWGKPEKVPFEDTELYGPEMIKDYLAWYFGDYMQLPPLEKRVCGHHSNLDFGKY